MKKQVVILDPIGGCYDILHLLDDNSIGKIESTSDSDADISEIEQESTLNILGIFGNQESRENREIKKS